MAKMHADEADIDADLVHRLLRDQFPQWVDLPVQPVTSGGTVNAVYRLGTELSVRLPLSAGGAEDLAREAQWLPRIAPALPVTVPSVQATGQPAEGYPWPWAVYGWIDGETPVEGSLARPDLVAADLARFITAMHGAAVDGGPHSFRGGPLANVDDETRSAITQLADSDEPFDAHAALAAWEESLAAAPWTAGPRWLHGDLMPSNLLVQADRLTAVLDFATVGIGDPAIDLIPAWNLLAGPARLIFRNALDVDDASWLRGRGWALSMAVIQLPYYRHTNPVISANARYVIREVLTSR